MIENLKDNLVSLSMKKIVKIVLWLALAVALIAEVQWLTFERQPLPEAVEALESDAQVTVSLEPWLTFIPEQNPTHTGFIFYQGGRDQPFGLFEFVESDCSRGIFGGDARYAVQYRHVQPQQGKCRYCG